MLVGVVRGSCGFWVWLSIPASITEIVPTFSIIDHFLVYLVGTMSKNTPQKSVTQDASIESKPALSRRSLKSLFSGRKNISKTLEDREHMVNKVHKKGQRIKLAALLVLVLSSYFGYKLFATTFAVIDRSGKPEALALQDSIRPDQLQREGDGRINILLLGIGGGGHEAGDLSDVNHIVSIDPFNHKVAVLGLPRDLYVPIPGYYTTRINAAHAFGERDGGKGAAVAEQTIENVLDVPIHYYAKVDFKGFEKAVDAVGGVDIEIEEDLYDSSYPTRNMAGTQVFSMKAGKHHLDGETALMVARCRKGTCGNDFGRADRQQKIMLAVKDKALSLGTVTNPSKITQLLDVAGENAKTDINLTTIGKLVQVADKLREKKVKPETFVLSTEPDNYLVGANVGGASVLVPKAGQANFADIQAFIRGELFRDGFLVKENANIVVVNGSGQSGLASSTAAMLKTYGYNAEASLEVPAGTYSGTKIYKISDKKTPFTTALLQKRLRTKLTKEKLPEIKLDKATDYIVVVGSGS